MSDRRQRARVQGSWASQRPQRPGASGHCASRSVFSPKSSGEQSAVIKVICSVCFSSSGEFEISAGPSGVSRLRLLQNFLSTEEADWMFSKLLQELPWSQKTNYSRGTAGPGPVDGSADGSWPPDLLSLRQRLLSDLRLPLNSCLCNLYRDGHDSIAWHSDDEASLGPRPVIASVSLGDTRVFSLRKKPPQAEGGDFTYSERIRVALSHGSLLVMEGATQDDWQHQVAKEYHDRGPRINLTFRTIHPEPRATRQGPEAGI
uniref:Fe2OG dioxygenase domain-containing protein n=1 Tax=Neogobius melanostomus TaxID=47308 RepID=A0A8C6UIG4_9GOBI